MAEKANVAKSTISKIETGQRKQTYKLMIDGGFCLGQDIHYINAVMI
ncbi:hypothetical protein [Lactobacillus sp. ESL0228]